MNGAVLYGRGYWEWEVVRRHSVFSSVNFLLCLLPSEGGGTDDCWDVDLLSMVYDEYR